MKNRKPIGDAASAITDRLSDRADFEKLAHRLRDVCWESADAGVNPGVVVNSLAAALSYFIAQVGLIDGNYAGNLRGLFQQIECAVAQAREADGLQ